MFLSLHCPKMARLVHSFIIVHDRPFSVNHHHHHHHRCTHRMLQVGVKVLSAKNMVQGIKDKRGLSDVSIELLGR